jgi:integrase
MVVLALHTGLRIGELRALRWDDVDLVSGKLHVRRSVYRADSIGPPKSGQAREVPLNSVALRVLRGHRHLRGPLVFCRADGAFLGETEPYEPLAGFCRRAGLRTVAFHTLRHTFAPHLVMRGKPMNTVQELLGHATIEMTMRYAHLSPDVRRDAVESLTEAAPIRPGYGPATGVDLQLVDIGKV